MAPKLRFHKIGSIAEPTIISEGEDGVSREDLVVGDVLMIVAEDIQGEAVFDLLAPAPGSTSVLVPITPLAEALVIDVTGRWRCRVADTFDGSRVQHTFAAPTVRRGLIPPAHNERASEEANEADVDPGTWVEESESNAGGKFTGYTDDIHKLYAEVEADAEAVKLDIPSEFDSLGSAVTAVAGDKVLIELASDGSKKVVDAADFLADSDNQTAAQVPFSPDGDIEATDTQAAVVEVRDDADTKLAGKSDTGHAHDHADITSQGADDHHAEDHASRHENGGADEINVDGLSGLLADAQTPASHMHSAADLTSGTLDDARVAESNVTQHEAAIDHDALANYAIAQHRTIDDGGASITGLWSSSKIDAELSAILAGLDVKPGVDTSTAGLGNIALTGEQTLNGLLTSSSRVIVVEQSVPADNGIYVSAAGAWSRASDADEDAEVTNGNITHVLDSGSTKFKYKYLLVTPDPITVGSTGQTWEEHRDIDFGTTGGTATEGNDSRLPAQDENDALVGTSGTASSANKYVTNADSRNSDARTPVAHALGGSEHTAATLAELNAQISDADLDDSGDARPPTAHTHAHADTTGKGPDDHHDETHTIASHDTDATGPELTALTDGSEVNGLHVHAPAQLFPWTFSTSTSAGDPGSGRVRMDSATQSAVTKLYFSEDDSDGFQFNNFFGNLVVGEEICGQQSDDSSRTVVFAISGAPVDEGGWWTIPVTFVSSDGALFTNNKATRWLIKMRF